jgi:CHAT domain-containing protein/tetratricopeptide (TPR) repeat protein
LPALSSYFLARQWRELPTELLAKAYRERRTLVLRIAKSEYSPVQTQRGQGAAHSERPPSLLDAEALIVRRLRKSPEDGSLLVARGQANLLDWSYEAAITDMQEALDSNTKSSCVLNVLATAYFERAEAEGRVDDYGTAFELQSRALQVSPDDTIILFNRAITGERLYLFKQSIEDWRHYLNLDTSGDWAYEAKQQLDEVQAAVDAHDRRTKATLLTPAEFVQEVDVADPESWERIEPRIEEYLSAAITNWLPTAFPVGGKATPSEDVERAIKTLAIVLRRKHGDTWLTELLSTSDLPSFGSAVAALSNATNADNVTEDYAFGKKESVRAALLFTEVGNAAGEMRARFEEVYSLAFSNTGPECLRRIARLSPLALSHSYKWITIQLSLERYVCSAQVSEVDMAPQLTRIVQSAQELHYAALALRATGFLADDERLRGRNREAWKLARRGLQDFWSSAVYPMPGYNLYSVMDVISEADQHWHLDTAIDEEALTLVSELANPLMLAVEHTSLAHAATLAAQPVVAKKNLRIASQLLTGAAPSSITDGYRLSVSIYEARVAAATGDTAAGLDRLTTIRPQLDRIGNENVLSEYYRTRGELDMLSGEFEGAQREFSAAVFLAERQRASIKSETDRLTWSGAWSGTYRSLVQAKLRSGDPLGALGTLELYRDAELRPAKTRSSRDIAETGQPAVTSEEQQVSEESAILNRTLPLLNDRTVLVYDVLSDGVAIWIYDSRGVTERWVQKNPADLEMLADHLRELCATPSSSIAAIQSTARRLYRILIGPVADYLRPAQPLVIEADQSLWGVPFQVLQDERGEYLADRHPIIYSPGLRYLASLLPRVVRIDANVRALVVANAAGGIDSGLRPLPDALSEAKDVAERFPQAKLLIEEEASLESVQRELPRAEIFHFAGHAGLRRGRSGLLLGASSSPGGPGVLDSWALEHVALPDLQLAVLSACSTENSDNDSVFGPKSLGRLFLRVGVPSVLATRWNVDSTSSAALMKKFYDLLLSGRTVGQSLGAAEADLRQRSPHPYYWAGFDVLGQD